MSNRSLMKSLVVCIGASALWVGCSSGPPVQKVEIEKPQFKVLDAAPGGREAWLDNPMMYAEKSNLEVKETYYYSGEGQSANKRMACDHALANVRDDVAKQVSTFVDTSIARAAGESTETTTSANGGHQSAVSEEVQKVSSQLSKTIVNDVKEVRRYWEQRDYSEVGGAKSIYYCWTLVGVGKKEVDGMISRANRLRLAQDSDLKAKVEGKIGNLSEEFQKYQKEHQ